MTNTAPTTVTDFWLKPIPLRQFDYSAHLEDYDGAPDAGFQPIGHGATKEAALADLLDQIAEHEADAAERFRREARD